MKSKQKYRVYRDGVYPKPKKHFYREGFETRRIARAFCRNRNYEAGVVIVHPDGTEEQYKTTGQ
jgi:hypothetical protein